MNIDVFDAQAQVVRQIELPDSIFGVEIKEHLLHEMVRYQLAMRRQGTAHTKNRSAVRGGGAQAVAAKRDWPCASGLANLSGLARRGDGVWPDATLLCLGHAQKETPRGFV